MKIEHNIQFSIFLEGQGFSKPSTSPLAFFFWKKIVQKNWLLVVVYVGNLLLYPFFSSFLQLKEEKCMMISKLFALIKRKIEFVFRFILVDEFLQYGPFTKPYKRIQHIYILFSKCERFGRWTCFKYNLQRCKVWDLINSCNRISALHKKKNQKIQTHNVRLLKRFIFRIL